MDELQQTLSELVQSGFEHNSVVNMLIEDYVKFHWVRFIFGSVLLLTFVFMTVFLLKRVKKTPVKCRFEKRVLKNFGVFGIVISTALLVVVAANASVLFNPSQGFKGFIEDFSASRDNNYSDEVRNAFNNWLHLGTGNTPPIIESEIQKITNAHRLNVIIFGISGVLIFGVSVWIWRNLIIKSNKFARVNDRLTTKDTLTLVFGSTFGTFTSVCSLLLIVMAEINLRWAISPLSAFLFFA